MEKKFFSEFKSMLDKKYQSNIETDSDDDFGIYVGDLSYLYDSIKDVLGDDAKDIQDELISNSGGELSDDDKGMIVGIDMIDKNAHGDYCYDGISEGYFVFYKA